MIFEPRSTTHSDTAVATTITTAIATLLLATAIGGRDEPPREAGQRHATPIAAPQSQAEAIPYPRAGWRLMDEKALDGFVVWPAHILIRYADSDDRVPFTTYEWHTTEPTPPRSRAQALALTEQVAAAVAEHPEAFGAFAAEYSEDAPTRAIGGELGGLRAADLADEPEVLDALSALRVGEVSRPVETAHGFHILVRRAPPVARVVTGRRIVISHDDADWQGAAARRPRRTLNEAKNLARELRERLADGAVDFDAVARQSSDWHDASGGSALGSLSLRQSSPLGRELAALERLEVGEVSPPLEGPLGLELLVRSENPTPEPERSDAELELPAITRPELDPLLARVPARVVMRELDALVEETPSAFSLTPDQRQLLAEARARSAPVRASPAEGPRAPSFADSVKAFLATDESLHYRRLLEERLAVSILNARVLRFRRKLTESRPSG